MLVKLADIHIAKIGNEDLSAYTSGGKQAYQLPAGINALNFDALVENEGSFDERMLKWAGEELLTGKYALVGNASNGKANNHFFNTAVPQPVNTTVNIAPQYLYSYLYLKRNQLTIQTKAGIRISKDKLAKISVPVPAFDTQLGIGPGLKKLVVKSETITSKVKKQIELLIREKDHAFDKAFKQLVAYLKQPQPRTGDEKIVAIRDVGFIQVGKTPNGSLKAYFGNAYPFFTQVAFEQGRDILNATKHLSERGIREAKLFNKDSLLVCFIGSQFGKAGIARVRGACNSQMLSVTCTGSMLPEYLYYQVTSPVFQQQMAAHANGLSISKTDFEHLYVEIPTLKKQAELVLELEKLHTSFGTRLTGLKAELARIEAEQSEEFAALVAGSK